MKKLLVLLVVVQSLFSCCEENKTIENSSEKEVIVTENKSVFVNIVLGSDKDEFSTKYKQGASALEALQYVARVETKPVAGKYVFVTKINDIAGVVGVNGWYYTINGEKAKTLAANYTVQPGDTIQWIFKADICSKKVKKAVSDD